jgi:hypothetical protein
MFRLPKTFGSGNSNKENFKFRILRIVTQNYNMYYITQKFGYLKILIQVFLNYLNCRVNFIKTYTLYQIGIKT